MKEIFKDIKGFEGKYQISNLGNIKSLINNIILKHRINKLGYCLINLGRGNQYYLHRLVAQTFIPNPNNLPQVNHIDGNKLNNNVDNLEWVTASYNTQHAWNIGLCNKKYGIIRNKNFINNNPMIGKTGSLHHNSKQLKCVFPNGDIKIYGGIREAARDLKISPSSISRSINLNIKNSKGLIFIFF